VGKFKKLVGTGMQISKNQLFLDSYFNKIMTEIKHMRQFKRSNVDKCSDSGEMPNAYTLQNQNGLTLQVMTYGATVTSLKIPVGNEMVNVVLGFSSLQEYKNSFSLPSAPYLGATIGRYAGRIANGTFQLNGKEFHLNKNNGNHSLHGGMQGLSQLDWKVKSVRDTVDPSITLTCVSPDGDENYPGELSVELTYALSEQNEFIVSYKATSTEDTVVNLTHHSYFNLDAHNSDISNQDLFVNSNIVLETTAENIPTGRFLNVEGQPFDFTSEKKCPLQIDSTFVLEKENGPVATLSSKKNNLKMSVFTDQPAVHIYVGGNCFNTIKGKESADYHPTSGICFETQNFPDAPNHASFPNSILKKGETYHHRTVYQFEIK
jgi:aldose 1-epimerase